jgi:hypothetical protein
MPGLPYPMRGVPRFHRENIEEYRQIFIDNGIDCL